VFFSFEVHFTGKYIFGAKLERFALKRCKTPEFCTETAFQGKSVFFIFEVRYTGKKHSVQNSGVLHGDCFSG